MPDLVTSVLPSNPLALTTLISTSNARCSKRFFLDADGQLQTQPYDYAHHWYVQPVLVETLGDLANVIGALSVLTNRCVIRGALRDAIDADDGVPRLSVGPRATFKEAPRSWVAIDVDGYDGSLAQFIAALVGAYPEFRDCGYVVQRTSSFGMRGPKLHVRLWYMLSHPATSLFWRWFFSRAPMPCLDTAIYRTVQIHYTAAPVFEGVGDPCAERVTLAEGRLSYVDLSGHPEDRRTTMHDERMSGEPVEPAITGHSAQIQGTLARLLRQTTAGARHHHAAGAIHELYAIGCPQDVAILACEDLIRRGGREPNPGECAQLWLRAGQMAAQGCLRTDNPPVSLAFEAEAPPAVPPPVAVAANTEVLDAQDTLTDWSGNDHYNAKRYRRAFLKGFVHWSARDYELTPNGYWRAMEAADTTRLRVSRDTGLGWAKAGNVTQALRSVHLREWLEPPCRLSNATRMDDVVLFGNGYMLRSELVAGRPTLRPHDPDHFALTVLSADYDAAATCPRFDQFLRELFPGDEVSQTMVLRIMAYLMIPDVSLQKFFMLVGVPNSGKSTLLKVINAIIGNGNTASVTDMEDLLETFGLQPLLDKLVIYMPEANILGSGRTARRVTNIIKQITGADRLTVNIKNAAQRNTLLPGRIVISCNTPPELGDESGALARRLVVVRFPVSFLSNPDTNLHHTLIAEREGIVNRLLAEIPALYASGPLSGIYTPDAARIAQESVLRDASPVATFISECTVAAPGAVLSTADTGDVAMRWCAREHLQPLSSISIGRALSRMGYQLTSRGGAGRAYLGVKLSELGESLRVGQF